MALAGLPACALPYSPSGLTRGGPGEGARSSRLGAGLALLLTLLAASVLGSLALTVLPERTRPAPVAPSLPPDPGTCTTELGPTSDLQGLTDGLRPGDVACLRAGVYGARGTRTDWLSSGTADEPITLRPAGDGEVLLRGFINLEGDHLVLDGVVFDGPTGDVDPANTPDGEEVLVWAHGDDLLLRRCEVRDGRWRAGIYVAGRDVVIDACWVHDIGPWDEPDQMQAGGRADNTDHGVYWGEGSSGVLTNSVLEHNLAYGVQISGGASGVLVANNTIVRNGTGGVIWAEDTSGGTLVNNIIAFNDGYAVNAHLLTGTANVMRHNLAWGNARGEWNDNGPLIARRNTVADPRFVSDDLRLHPDSPARDAGTVEGAPRADRRGHPRPQGQAPDLGAYELPPGLTRP